MKKKNITIDDLAIMVKRGFDGVDKRFDGVDKRMNKIKDRLERIEKLLIAQHEERIRKLEFDSKRMKEIFAIK